MSEAGAAQLETLAERHYAAGDGTRKPASYFEAYSRILQGRRDAPLRILELGVSSGASLLIWRDYLPAATIIGVDIADPPTVLAGDARIQFVKGSQDDPTALDEAARLAGGAFDLIVDDASHIGFLTKRSFNHLFPRWLVAGGWYVIEDLGTSFLPEYPDGKVYRAPPSDDAVPVTIVFEGQQNGMVGVVKQLIDHLMQELSTGIPSALPIQSITVESNIAFIQKSGQPGQHGAADLSARPVHLDDRVSADLVAIRQELARQNRRLDEIAGVVGRLTGLLTPFRSAWRTINGRREPTARNRES